MKYLYALLAWAMVAALPARAQDASEKAVSWQYSAEKKDAGTFLLHAKGTIEDGWILFSTTMPDTSVNSRLVVNTKGATITGIQEEGKLESRHDSVLDAEVRYFEHSVELVATVKANDSSTVLKGSVQYMVMKGAEVSSVIDNAFVATVAGGGAATAADDTSNKSLWWIFLACFGGGFLALLTPCVYSLIPITVGFFTKRSPTRAIGIRNAFFYSISIIVIYTFLGFLITRIFGPGALNALSSNAMANLIFFAIFLLFGISFLGAFELTLPGSWSNAADSKASAGNFGGIFFMALTLAIVSFSCTGPIIGNLLVLASKGGVIGPLVGMFGFSLALAIPFSLFALFPSMLNKLGKSGGWLNAVKVVLGLLELALALKFFSNADMAYHWHLLDREVFLSLWIVLFSITGFYLLGKIKFSHDSDLPYVSIPRLFFAIVTFTFVVYMVPGLWGAPLKGISGFLPHEGSQDFNLHRELTNLTAKIGSGGGTAVSDNTIKPKKYTDILESEIPGVETLFFDYQEAIAASKAAHKPLMLDFTGHSCVNCRKFEKSVLSDPQVMKVLHDDFIVASLYTDEKTELPESEQYVSKLDGTNVKNVGQSNADFEAVHFNRNSQPYYIPVDGEGSPLVSAGYGYDPKENVAAFLAYLESAKAEYKKRGK
ncbi:thiol:disulfide interchange protein DsbD [Chitinophaga costaii]|uniref:Thiol:disulfide interchange protein DsbD n=1 Tax=Chitinophaga costaii TaxID=1335309 RepID=A0A1C4BQK7_9BACT|nr:thioredoxin family protein [Chitinophaga costaii]PUZ27514.1 protein-disulfide reductase [Chitinophaga costaii]SCC09137.1 thiol:disulfide interchange protein DsbD [Chitinophaga costaii]